MGAAVEATDGDNDALTYELGGADARSFSIVGNTGQIQTKAQLDHEAKATYTVTVTATDPSRKSDTVTVTITVIDANDPPAFPSSETRTRTVDENTPPGDAVGTPVSAEDEDEDTEGNLAYSLGGTGSASFGIDSSTGQITVGTGTRLDYETKASYEVTVTATDSSHVSATITVTIEVLNVDEKGVVTLSHLQPPGRYSPDGYPR